jgi:peroxiredoxin
MTFFNSFYKQKLQTFSKTKEGAPLNFNINNKGSYSGSMDVLKRDKYLQNDTIRELVLIKGLFEGYYDGSFDRQGIKAILNQVLEQSQVEEHKRIAQNCLSSFSKLQKGVAAPFFELPDKNGITHSLDELRTKKYVYLMFFDANCVSCMQQMKVIPSLKKTYGGQIEFVAISTDKSNADLKNFTAKYPKYDWTFLYDNSNGNLKKSYEIITLPTYFLISPEGKFIQVPADSPENNIEELFFELTKPKEKRHGIGNKQNN